MATATIGRRVLLRLKRIGIGLGLLLALLIAGILHEQLARYRDLTVIVVLWALSQFGPTFRLAPDSAIAGLAGCFPARLQTYACHGGLARCHW